MANVLSGLNEFKLTLACLGLSCRFCSDFAILSVSRILMTADIRNN